MRVERTGKVSAFTPRLVQYMKQRLAARSLDDIESPQSRRIDYACLNGLLAVEIKSLEEDGSERMDNLVDELRLREDWPEFLGSAPMEAFIKHTNDPEKVRLQVLNRVGRAIINHLKKANKQLRAHVETFPRKNIVRVMLLVNEDHEIYEPNTVCYVLWHALRRREEGALLYPDIDAVIYMSERHATVVDGRVALPIACIEGQPIADGTWKRLVLNQFVEGWADWNSSPVHDHDDLNQFSTIDHIPESMPRHEAWRIEYRRNPYMRGWSDEKVRERFDESTLLSAWFFLKDSPLKPSAAANMENLRLFTHLMLELAERSIPISHVPSTPERRLAAAKRLNMPDSVIAWLTEKLP